METQVISRGVGRPGISDETWNRAVELLRTPGTTPKAVATELGLGLTKVYEIRRHPRLRGVVSPSGDGSGYESHPPFIPPHLGTEPGQGGKRRGRSRRSLVGSGAVDRSSLLHGEGQR